ncbi:hypothetical protein ACIBFB_05525 [Nocardiopsis sp. NPDC050513]|uniref:hypothetical protein n=1 Tax=Nocardiopsis sp. NPDC050513 TaxID=3364338 RepID=UPI00378DBC78
MQIDERSDGAEEALLHAIHLQMEIARAVGRSANARIAARLRDQRRREQAPGRRERRERKQTRARWKEDRKTLRGVGRDSWWKDATPAKIQDAALAAHRHRDDRWRARIAGWNLNRGYERRFGASLDELVQNNGPDAPGTWTDLERMGAEAASIVPGNAREQEGLDALFGKLERMEQDEQYLAEQLGLPQRQGERSGPVQQDEQADEERAHQQDRQPLQPQTVQEGEQVQAGGDGHRGEQGRTSAQDLLGRGRTSSPPTRQAAPQEQDQAARRRLDARRIMRGSGRGRGD